MNGELQEALVQFLSDTVRRACSGASATSAGLTDVSMLEYWLQVELWRQAQDPRSPFRAPMIETTGRTSYFCDEVPYWTTHSWRRRTAAGVPSTGVKLADLMLFWGDHPVWIELKDLGRGQRVGPNATSFSHDVQALNGIDFAASRGLMGLTTDHLSHLYRARSEWGDGARVEPSSYTLKILDKLGLSLGPSLPPSSIDSLLTAHDKQRQPTRNKVAELLPADVGLHRWAAVGIAVEDEIARLPDGHLTDRIRGESRGLPDAALAVASARSIGGGLAAIVVTPR